MKNITLIFFLTFLFLACDNTSINSEQEEEIIPLKIDDTKIYFGESEKEKQIKIISGNDDYKIIYHKESKDNNFVVSLEKATITIKLQIETVDLIEEIFLLVDGKDQRKVFAIANHEYYGGLNPDGSIIDLDEVFGSRNDIWNFQ